MGEYPGGVGAALGSLKAVGSPRPELGGGSAFGLVAATSLLAQTTRPIRKHAFHRRVLTCFDHYVILYYSEVMFSFQGAFRR